MFYFDHQAAAGAGPWTRRGYGAVRTLATRPVGGSASSPGATRRCTALEPNPQQAAMLQCNIDPKTRSNVVVNGGFVEPQRRMRPDGFDLFANMVSGRTAVALTLWPWTMFTPSARAAASA